MKKQIISDLKKLLNDKEIRIFCGFDLEKSIEQRVIVKSHPKEIYIRFFTTLDLWDEDTPESIINGFINTFSNKIKKLEGNYDDKYDIFNSIRENFKKIEFPVGKLYLSEDYLESINYLSNNRINIYVRESKEKDSHINKISIKIF